MKYKVTIISDADSWINYYVPNFLKMLQNENCVTYWMHDVKDILDGDFAFYLGCGQMVVSSILARNKHNLIIHESDLPKGKGWSPLTWQILEGKNEVPVCLFEAVEAVDSGKIYIKEVIRFKGTELVEELRQIQAETSINMCMKFIQNYPDIINNGVEQQGQSTFYKRRTPVDSLIDLDKTIREQFNLLRIVDNERYPAYFQIDDETYILKIYKQ